MLVYDWFWPLHVFYFILFLGVRRPEETKKSLEELREQGIKGGSYEVFQLDLMSLESVRQFANQILTKNMPIHVLLNNGNYISIFKHIYTIPIGFASFGMRITLAPFKIDFLTFSWNHVWSQEND